ncbi:MAG: hypothetical protein HQL69_17620 [Magnetococcales bacterium]|nr:hypothetical protein [Magnetococcales bacterium]
MSIDLTKSDPVWLGQTAKLDDILAAVNRVKNWQEYMVRALDLAYRIRFSHLLRNRASSEEMEDLAVHLEDVACHPKREGMLNSFSLPYASRWRVLQDILEDRLAARDHKIPDEVKNRRYVPEIMALLDKHKIIRQQLLRKQIPGLGEANLTRIINMLEKSELVSRQKHGRENYLTLGPRAEEVLPPNSEQIVIEDSALAQLVELRCDSGPVKEDELVMDEKQIPLSACNDFGKISIQSALGVTTH